MSMLCKALASQTWCWLYMQVLWPESGWKPVPLVDIIEGTSVKRAYQKALLCLHPDKLQQKGAASHQKYIAEKVFEILQVSYSLVVFFLRQTSFPPFKVGVLLFFTELPTENLLLPILLTGPLNILKCARPHSDFTKQSDPSFDHWSMTVHPPCLYSNCNVWVSWNYMLHTKYQNASIMNILTEANYLINVTHYIAMFLTTKYNLFILCYG